MRIGSILSSNTKLKNSLCLRLLALIRETRILFRRMLLWLWLFSDGNPTVLPSRLEVLLFQNSNLFPKSMDERSRYLIEWQKIESLWNNGFYHKAVDKRIEILHEMYDNSFSSTEPVPRFYSPSYTTNIGHLGNLFSNFRGLLNAQPSMLSRIILCNEIDMKLPFLRLAFPEDQVISLPRQNSWSGIFDFQALFERLDTFRVGSTFVDYYQYASDFLHSGSPFFKSYTVSLLSSLEEHLSAAAKDFFETEDKFVTIQVRKSTRSFDIRNQEFETYIAAINFLKSEGHQVVFLGSHEEHFFGAEVDIYSALRNEWTFVDQVYSLLKSRFHVGTTSGPTFFAHALDIPVLHTNATSIGRNLLGLNQNSLHIPKRIQIGHKLLNFHETLSTPFAYCESTKEVKRTGVQFIDNSERDILEGVKHMLQLTASYSEKAYNEIKKSNEHVAKVREELKGVSKGMIAPSFLETYPYWIDSS